MKKRPTAFALILAFILLTAGTGFTQTTAAVKRTTYKTDTLDFGPGGTLSIIGAPSGSIRVEGWNSNQIKVEAEIEISAQTEAQLDELAKVTGFIMHENMGKTAITTIGTHDRSYLKKVARKFPKELIGLPFRIDYVIKVPRYCDLQIDGGKGDLFIAGIDGTFKINFLESTARLDLVGGGVFATFGAGTVDVKVPSRNWRGRFADVQLAAGTMNVSLPPSLNAEVDATVLRSGSVENSFADLKPRTRKDTFTEKLIAAKSGVGGIPLKFTVGDGRLNIFEMKKPE